MNAVQILGEIQTFTRSPEGQLIMGIIEGDVSSQLSNKVDNDLEAYLQANPNVAVQEAVTTVSNREFHNLRVRLGWLGFLVDGLANDTQVVSKVTSFVQSRITAGEQDGAIMVNSTTGTISLAPPPAPPSKTPPIVGGGGQARNQDNAGNSASQNS